MNDLAVPVHRGNFIYQRFLFADPGYGGRPHSRACPDYLATLLRPDGPQQAEDKPWHWYRAQLLHYDLLLTFDVELAKHRLLNALNTSELEVPPTIQELESEMQEA